MLSCMLDSRLRIADTNRPNKLVRKASNVVGVELDSLTVVSERRMLSKLCGILDNVSHPLHDVLIKHRSTFSRRLFPPRCTAERHRKLFLPVAIKLNSSPCLTHNTLNWTLTHTVNKPLTSNNLNVIIVQTFVSAIHLHQYCFYCIYLHCSYTVNNIYWHLTLAFNFILHLPFHFSALNISLYSSFIAYKMHIFYIALLLFLCTYFSMLSLHFVCILAQ